MDALCSAMNLSFSDYTVPMILTTEAFGLMMRQRGLDLAASRVVVIRDEIAAIWLVSVRDEASYLISSGTAPEFRRRGLARKLALDCLSGLRHSGIGSFQTEVLMDNTQASNLYVSLGMRTARTLDCYTVSVPEFASTDHEVCDVPWASVSKEVGSLQEFEPTWQNNTASLDDIAEHVSCRAVIDDTGLLGYAAVISDNGTLAQIAVRKDSRRRGIARALLRSWPGVSDLRVINVDTSSDALRAFMLSLGARRTLGQYELSMKLLSD